MFARTRNRQFTHRTNHGLVACNIAHISAYNAFTAWAELNGKTHRSVQTPCSMLLSLSKRYGGHGRRHAEITMRTGNACNFLHTWGVTCVSCVSVALAHKTDNKRNGLCNWCTLTACACVEVMCSRSVLEKGDIWTSFGAPIVNQSK